MARIDDLYKLLAIKKACGRTKNDIQVNVILNEIKDIIEYTCPGGPDIHPQENCKYDTNNIKFRFSMPPYGVPDSQGDVFMPGCFDTITLVRTQNGFFDHYSVHDI